MARFTHPPVPAAIALLMALAVAGCGSSSASSGQQMGSQSSGAATSAPAAAVPAGPAVQSATVDINSFKFTPATIVVKKGGPFMKGTVVAR
jgi:uncharacterized lipoprotein